MHLLRTALVASVLFVAPTTVPAQINLGPKSCEECHDIEFDKWRETQHSTGYSDFHKRPAATEMAAAVGDAANPKDNAVCQTCHYTLSRTKSSATVRPRSGPSCESCHGASSGWHRVHRDYGGRQVRARDEAPEHKRERIEQSTAAGMVWAQMRYDLAAACFRCHGLTNPELSTDTLGALLAAGHPTEPDFEYVRFSQGSMRHRFYPPDIDINQDMPDELLARVFVVGLAAQMVHSQAVLAKLSEGAFATEQHQKIERARQSLEKASHVAEIRAFLDQPTEGNARAMLEAIREVDLHPQVGSELPNEDQYQ